MSGCWTLRPRRFTWLTKDKWEISGGNFSPDGKHVTWTANVDGNTDIYLHDLSPARPRAAAAQGRECAGGAEIRHSATMDRGCSTTTTGATAPNDVWVYQLATGKSHQVTHSLVAGVRAEDMVEPFLVHYPSRDGKWTISAFVYVPCNMQRNGQNAAIVYVHGGPTVADGEFVQPVYSAHRQSGIHGDCAELSRVNRIRQRISAGESVRHGRRRFAGRAGGGGFHQADGLSRSEEDRRWAAAMADT